MKFRFHMRAMLLILASVIFITLCIIIFNKVYIISTMSVEFLWANTQNYHFANGDNMKLYYIEETADPVTDSDTWCSAIYLFYNKKKLLNDHIDYVKDCNSVNIQYLSDMDRYRAYLLQNNYCLIIDKNTSTVTYWKRLSASQVNNLKKHGDSYIWNELCADSWVCFMRFSEILLNKKDNIIKRIVIIKSKDKISQYEKIFNKDYSTKEDAVVNYAKQLVKRYKLNVNL